MFSCQILCCESFDGQNTSFATRTTHGHHLSNTIFISATWHHFLHDCPLGSVHLILIRLWCTFPNACCQVSLSCHVNASTILLQQQRSASEHICFSFGIHVAPWWRLWADDRNTVNKMGGNTLCGHVLNGVLQLVAAANAVLLQEPAKLRGTHFWPRIHQLFVDFEANWSLDALWFQKDREKPEQNQFLFLCVFRQIGWQG